MNTKLMLEVADLLDDEPEGYCQGLWVNDDTGPDTYGKCGTPACLAGWICYAKEASIDGMIPLVDASGRHVQDRAMKYLEIGPYTAMDLFDGNPYGVDEYAGPDPTSKQAAAVMRRLAETGEVDWRDAADLD